MRILGIDTSGKVAAAALYDSEAGCLLAPQSVYTKRTHSQVILPLAERLLADTGLQWQDVDGFAVAKGPGSYTGLRIGIAAVSCVPTTAKVAQKIVSHDNPSSMVLPDALGANVTGVITSAIIAAIYVTVIPML